MKLKALILLVFITTALHAAEYGKVEMKKVADGIYLFRTSPYGDVGMSGNCVAILTDESVVVFDSSATPQTASTILSEIKKLTDKPVGYLINSHWHWDHWGGNEVFLAANPELQIISHEKTLEQLKTVEPRWNSEGLKVGLPQYVSDLQKQVEKAKKDQVDPSKLKSMEELLAADQNFLEQKTSLKKTLPNKTFKDRMTIHPGSREIQILHARAITVGDTFLYLPKEKILITGDILLSPYPFAIGGSYPEDWLNTLETFAELKPSVVIPGHGDAQNYEFIDQNIAMFEKVIRLVKNSKAHGHSVQRTKELVANQKAELAELLRLSDPQKVADFNAYFLGVFTARAYRELDKPLDEFPDGLPQN